jgi:hypothetical protein
MPLLKALDGRAGLQLLIDDGRVFECFNTLSDAVFHAEMGSSAVILNAGYNIDSFMVSHASASSAELS